MHPFRRSSEALLHPDETKPAGPALSLLTSVWVRRRSGLLHGPHGETLVILGRPTNHDGLIRMVEGMYSGGLVFRDGPRLERPGHASLAPHLYEAGRRVADQSALVSESHRVLIDAPGAHASARFPLRPGTRALLLRRRGVQGVPLAAFLARYPADRPDIIEDLSVLMALGLLRYRRQEGLVTTNATDAEAQPPPRKRTDMLARRLRRDLDRMEGADDWHVLGVKPMMSDAVIERACDKMLGRYGHLVADASIPPIARDLARLLHHRVSNAVARIRPHAQSSEATP